MPADRPSPLDGVRVLEVANWLAAPACASFLCDMGAEVTKVESTGGDSWRYSIPELSYPEGASPWNPGFNVDNRGKKSVAIDVGSPEGREIVLDLARDVDVFITNLTLPRAKRYGLSYADVRKENPRVIYLHLTGYGIRGPEKDRPGFDDVAFWASSGIMSTLGEPGRPPVQNRASLGDKATALGLLSGVLAALFQRERTGRGEHLTASLLSTGLWVFSDELQGYLETGSTPPRRTREEPYVATHDSYRLKDGTWIMLAMPPQRFWPRIVRALDLPPPAGDPDLLTTAGHIARAPEVVRMLDAALAKKTLRQVYRRFREEDLIWSVVANAAQVVADPQVAANDMLADVGPYRVVRHPVHFAGSRVEPRGPAPAIGQHADEVLAAAGYPPDRIAKLRESGVIR